MSPDRSSMHKLFNHVIRFRAKNRASIFGDILIRKGKGKIQDGGREDCPRCEWGLFATF